MSALRFLLYLLTHVLRYRLNCASKRGPMPSSNPNLVNPTTAHILNHDSGLLREHVERLYKYRTSNA